MPAGSVRFALGVKHFLERRPHDWLCATQIFPGPW